ncbi:PEP/pyruvate-binding domain-containing protein [Actinacidiphila guanduensis]|uniref:Pyruvate, water dikinase n=1 Tax=Actinacidiphila guanduensis TaxID=310781 RepID=A0A1H0PNZ8_9ACTN|nr:PEP/pyruvate-binding domain-containing protein [Actinacidiphila guanduensis]SDP06308.1 pyruvate, water dikinase [Actinacidiphila guanduensis]
MAIDTGMFAVAALDSEGARDPSVVGAKAANLARSAAAGLPVLPGFVLVASDRAPRAPAGHQALRAAWRQLGGAERPLVVRSSSVHEDTEASSMAGRFTSVLDVRGWEPFTAAVEQVLDSAADPAAEAGEDPLHDMAVLVQPMLSSTAGGVMFGADPVEGRYDHILVSAVDGGPDQLVDGSTQGVRYQLTRHGRLLRTEPALPRGRGPLGRQRLNRLVRLARRTEKVHGAPQDIEFGFDGDGRLWLFQARPITAMAARPRRGARLLGPGPVAETLPGVLQPLEEDLWLAPMNRGLALALDIAGAAPRRKLRRLPVATTVDGRAAADLRLLGAVPPAHPVLTFMNPAPGARRAAAAWRVGRLRTALPLLARNLMAEVDKQLHDLAEPRQMLGGELLSAVAWGREVLASLHAQESLAGALLDTDTGSTAAGEALAVLAEGRHGGSTDEELIAHHPVLLALVPPSLDGSASLPAQAGWNGVPRGIGFLSVREGLRLRIRWVQEMQARMVREMGIRMDERCAAGERGRIALLRWGELVTSAEGGARPADLAERVPRPRTPPLPAAFRLAGGRPQAVAARPRRRFLGLPGRGEAAGAAGQEGQGAGGGYGTGTVWDGRGERPAGAVLVTGTLDPALAPLLPGLAGLVAETGSVLSHLAVLAREYGVPTAVGVPRALARFAPGTVVTVDGATGAVRAVPGEPAGSVGSVGASSQAEPLPGGPLADAPQAGGPSAGGPRPDESLPHGPVPEASLPGGPPPDGLLSDASLPNGPLPDASLPSPPPAGDRTGGLDGADARGAQGTRAKGAAA